MIGRPRKTRLAAVWDEARKRWRVTIPASWAGKMARRWFESQSAAELWIAQRELEKVQERPLTLVESIGSGKSIQGLVALFLSEKKGVGRKTTAIHLDKLVARFGGSSMEELHPYAIREWHTALKVSQRTRFGIFSSCRSLGRWAVRYQFASVNPFEQVEPPDKGIAPKAILTVEQMKKLLEIPKVPYMQAWIVLGGLAGLRTEEIHRLNWDALDFDAKEIHVAPHVIKQTKGVRERYVAMLPAFLRWIPRGMSGKIIGRQRSTFHWHAVRLAKKLGYESWPHNCLRHSFASYHLAEWEDAGKTAHQLGHTSTQMVHSNYARAVKKADAARWWAM